MSDRKDGGPICGNCGKPYGSHYFEREVYCNTVTNGDIWSDDPPEEWVAQEMMDRHPELADAIIREWKERNGHMADALLSEREGSQ
jgi:hypothetical protein